MTDDRRAEEEATGRNGSGHPALPPPSTAHHCDTCTCAPANPRQAAADFYALLFAPCCEHCGCPEGGDIGHDDTCAFGCNDKQAE